VPSKKALSTKSEILNKYKAQMTKIQKNKFQYLNFEFWICLGFRD